MKALISLAASMCCLLAVADSASAQQNYPLRVRGGGNLKIWGENTKTPGLSKLIVQFSFANVPAGSGLKPGQGSWMDRGGRPGEPGRLEYFTQENEAQRIVDFLKSPANYFTFECHNTGKGYMQVTKAYVKSVRID
jgi:hypothetical protein